MLLFIALVLLTIAVLYGVCFLVFKLIWVLLKKKRNFWPLILAGAATLLIVLLTVLACVRTYKQYLQPLTPIVEAAAQQQEAVYGTEMYVNPTYGFSLTLKDGMTLSDWINVEGQKLILGLDVNLLNQQESDYPLHMLILLRSIKDNPAGTAQEILQQLVSRVQDTDNAYSLEMSEIEPMFVRGNEPGALLTGHLQNPNNGLWFYYTCLIAKEGDTVYYLLGIDDQENKLAEQTVRSFRFRPDAAAPLPLPNAVN